MSSARMNYWVDVGIGIAGLISAISGLVFLLPGNPATGILGIGYRTWSGLHTWSSLVAIAGVGAHMVLHRKWLVAMTRQMVSPTQRRRAGEGAPAGAPGEGLSRRAFLVFGGAAAVVAGFKVLQADMTEANLSSSRPAATDPEGSVACPYGRINDPYPGRCRFYTDMDGDGICDYSVPGSGNNFASDEVVEGSLEGFSGKFHRRRGRGRP